MITTPDRVGEAIAAIERGEQVDWQRLANLQLLDLVHAGRMFVEDAIRFQETEYDRAASQLTGQPG